MKQRSPTVEEPSVGTSRWGDSPWIAFAIRTLVFVVPVLLSLFVTWALAKTWAAPATIPAAMARFLVLAGVAVVVGAAADKSARRFLPLAALFRLSLVFPDQAPSRFAVALRSGNTRRVEQRLAEVESGGFEGDEAEAALLVVELAAALSQHDRLTRGHSERVRAYTALIAEEMGMGAEDSNKLQWAGLIHDVGKLRIPASILTKPGRLTAEEFEIIKTHPAEGLKIAEPLRGFLGPWIGAVGEHHERFDGGGYPNGLSGTDISLAGRIVAVADAYDVITAARSYKKPLSPAFARRELAENAGSQFDPVVVRAFLGISLGRLRRAMWPLSWAVQVPFVGTAVTTPIAQTIAATVVAVATATGVTATTGGFDAFTVPEAIAMVDTEDSAAGKPSLEGVVEPGSNIDPATSGPAVIDLPGATTAPAQVPVPSSQQSESDAIVASDEEPATTTPGEVAPSTSATNPTSRTVPTSPPAAIPTTPTTAVTTTTTTETDCQRAQAGDGALSGANLSSCDLTGVVLTGGVFDNADLSNAVLTDTKLLGGSFVGATFDDAVLTSVEIRDADLRNSSWRETEILFSGLANVDLRDSDLRGVTIEDVGITGNLSAAVLDDAKIARVGFDGSTMSRTSLRSASISQTSFTNGVLGQIDLRGSMLDEVTFEGAQMVGARLDNVNMTGAIFVSANLTGAEFTAATIVDTNFYAATISNASFADASLTNINMVDVVGTGTNFAGALLDGGSMVSAQMHTANFDGAELIGWDFNGALLTNTRFDGASFLTSSLQSANASGAAFTSADFGDAGLWFFNAALASADFTGALGRPNQPETGNYSVTTCPNGTTQSVSCW